MAGGKETPKEEKQEPSVRRGSKSIWPWKKETDGSASFLRAARAGNLEKVLEFLKTNTDINTCNANGLNALHLASKEGHTDVVSALLDRSANVDAATKKGNTALHIASLAGQDEIVKVLVEHGATVNIQSQNGFTPLYMAAQENHDSVVRFLLSHGANQSLATEDGFTPLAVALQQGHDRVVSVLLENDTRGKVRLPALHIAAKKDDAKAAALLLHTDHNPDITSKSGFTPLHIASHYGNDNIAGLLIQRGADVNYVAKHQITPLHVASKWGKGNMVSLLLDKGANIEAKTRDGLTPLHCAARSGHETVVDMLLEKGAPITAKTKNGLAPLHMASQGDHVDAARILLYHKAPVDDVTVDFLTALHVAAHCGHVRVAKLLLDRKADPNSRALNGFTPLHIACKKNRIKVVELLLKHGASIEATTESGLTPLHVASFMGCMNIVIYLIQHGASADVPTVRGESPLHLAARANQTDIIRILLRNGAEVDAKAREQQTALHIASRLGNTDIVGLLLQQGASVDAPTKDLYTPLHIAAKEGQEEVAGVLLDHGASLNTPTKKGFTPLHLAAKYGHLKVARLLLQRDAPVDPKGKNGVTPLHVAAHYDHQNVAMLLLDKGAQPHATAKNGYTPLHIAARKNQMDIAGTLLEYGANANAESKAGFTPLHLSAQEGHTDMATLLLEHGAQPGGSAKNGLTPLHLCAQEDRVPVGAILVKHGAAVDAETKAGYTPLHVAAHFGQMNMVRFLLQHGTKVDAPTQLGYTPLHQAAQQGHTQIVNLLLENKAQPNMETNDGKTALSIAQRLGYISVVETLKIVTETRVQTNTTTTTEEKYKVVVPETMHETFMSESEDEGADDTMLGDQSYRYLTVDEMKSLGDDSLPIDVTRDEKMDVSFQSNLGTAPGEHISPQHKKEAALYAQNYPTDNIDVGKAPILAGPESLNTTMNTTFNPPEDDVPQFNNDESRTEVPDQGTTPKSQTPATVTPKMTQNEEISNIWDQFLVSFMVDARGGAMRGCRHSGVRVIIPPRKAAMPMRITCRYLKKDKLVHAPPLMEGEALSSRILEMGPSGAKFLGPVIIEVPHFASLRGKEREIVILRSDNGETWREHTLEATEEAVQEVLNESFDGEELKQLEDLNTNRITRILTTDFPQYFAIVTRIRQEVHAIGPEGGMVSSTVVPQVQAVFPQGALTKKIKVGLQAQPISTDLVAKLLGNRVAVSPIVTVEPRRRKFHKPITLTIPVPQAASKGMINQYSGEAPTLRLLCSITGGTTRAQWEDVTGSTPLTFVNDCVSFTTTVSARFWLMDCTNIPEATKMATELYREAIHVPFMAKFVVFSKRHQLEEARVRVFCMTDDKEDKTLESQEHFIEVAKSRDVEVLEGKSQYLEFAGNLIPVTKSGDQLAFNFYAFRENRLPFTVRVKDQNAESCGRVAFMRQPKVGRGEAPQSPICTLNLSLPDNIQPEPAPSEPDLLALEKKYAFLSISKAETIHKADLRLSDISNMLASDWVALAKELEISDSDINIIKTQYPDNTPQQAIVMLRLWMQTSGNKATGNTLQKALRAIHRDDIVNECICNMEVVTDVSEKATAEEVLVEKKPQSNLVEEITPAYDEKDIMKDAESVEEEEIAHKTMTERQKEKDETYEAEERKYAAEEKIVKEIEDNLLRKEKYPVKEEEILPKDEKHSPKTEEKYLKDEKKLPKEEKKPAKDDKKPSKDDKKGPTDDINYIKEEIISKKEKIISEIKSEETIKKKGNEIEIEKKEESMKETKEERIEEKREKSQEKKTFEKKEEEKEVLEEKKVEERQLYTTVSKEEQPKQPTTTVTTTQHTTSEDGTVTEHVRVETRTSTAAEIPKPGKEELLQKLGEELGKLDEKLEEKFKEKNKQKLAVSIEEEQEVSEMPIVPQPRSSTIHPTSQIIVESVREPENEEIEDDVVQSVYDAHVPQEIEIRPEDHFALKDEREVSDSKESSDSEIENEESLKILVDNKLEYSEDSEAIVEETIHAAVESEILKKSEEITYEELPRDDEKSEHIEETIHTPVESESLKKSEDITYEELSKALKDDEKSEHIEETVHAPVESEIAKESEEITYEELPRDDEKSEYIEETVHTPVESEILKESEEITYEELPRDIEKSEHIEETVHTPVKSEILKESEEITYEELRRDDEKSEHIEETVHTPVESEILKESEEITYEELPRDDEKSEHIEETVHTPVESESLKESEEITYEELSKALKDDEKSEHIEETVHAPVESEILKESKEYISENLLETSYDRVPEDQGLFTETVYTPVESETVRESEEITFEDDKKLEHLEDDVSETHLESLIITEEDHLLEDRTFPLEKPSEFPDVRDPDSKSPELLLSEKEDSDSSKEDISVSKTHMEPLIIAEEDQLVEDRITHQTEKPLSDVSDVRIVVTESPEIKLSENEDSTSSKEDITSEDLVEVSYDEVKEEHEQLYQTKEEQDTPSEVLEVRIRETEYSEEEKQLQEIESQDNEDEFQDQEYHKETEVQVHEHDKDKKYQEIESQDEEDEFQDKEFHKEIQIEDQEYDKETDIQELPYDKSKEIQEEEYYQEEENEDLEYDKEERSENEDYYQAEKINEKDVKIPEEEFSEDVDIEDQKYFQKLEIKDQEYYEDEKIHDQIYDEEKNIKEKEFDQDAEIEDKHFDKEIEFGKIKAKEIEEQEFDQEGTISYEKDDKKSETLDQEYDKEPFIQEKHDVKVETQRDQSQELFIQEPIDTISHEGSHETPMEFEIISREAIESEEYAAKDILQVEGGEEESKKSYQDVKIELISGLEHERLPEAGSESDVEDLSDQEHDVHYGDYEEEEDQLVAEDKYDHDYKEEQLLVSNQFVEQDLVQDPGIRERLSTPDIDVSQNVEKEITKEKESEEKLDHSPLEEIEVIHSRLDYSSDDEPPTSMEPLGDNEFAFENKYFQEYEAQIDSGETVPKSEFLIESETSANRELLEHDLLVESDHEDAADNLEAFSCSEIHEDVEKETKSQDGLTQPSAETSQMESGQSAPSDVKPPTASVADEPTPDLPLSEKVAGDPSFGVNFKLDEDDFPSRITRRGYYSEESPELISKADSLEDDLVSESTNLSNMIYHLETYIESSQNVTTDAGESETKSSGTGTQALQEGPTSNGLSSPAHRPTTLNISYSGEVDENESNDSCCMARKNELISQDEIPVVNKQSECHDVIEEGSSKEDEISAQGNQIISASNEFVQKPKDVADASSSRLERLARPSMRSAILKVKVEKRFSANHSAKEKNSEGYSKENIQCLPQLASTTSRNKSQNTSIEDEVLGLMAEVQEVTKEIKKDVKRLRDSESPTPETPTPLREFKDFICKEEEQELARLPTISEIGKEADEEGTTCGIAGEMDSNLTYKNHISTLSLCANQTQLKASINNLNLADVSQSKQNHEVLGEASAAFPCDVNSINLNSLDVKTHIPENVVDIEMPCNNRLRAVSHSSDKLVLNRAFTQTYSNLSNKPYGTLSDFMKNKTSLISVRSCYFCTRDFLLNDVCNDLIEIISFVEQGVKFSKKLNTLALISSLDNLKYKLGSIFDENVNESVGTGNESNPITTFDQENSKFKSECDSSFIENKSDYYLDIKPESTFLTMPSVENGVSSKQLLLPLSNAISEGNGPDYLTDVEEIALEDGSTTQDSSSPLKKSIKQEDAPSDEDKVTDEENIENSDFDDDIETKEEKEITLEDFLLNYPQGTLSLTEGYAKDQSPLQSEGEHEDIDIEKRHLKNVRVTSVAAEALGTEDIIQHLTDEENMIDVVNDPTESEKEEDIGSSLPDHYLQEDDSFSKHEAVTSVSLSQNEFGIKKSIPYNGQSLQVHPEEAEEKTDVEDLESEISTCKKRLKRRKPKAKKSKSPLCPPPALIPEFGGGELTDTEILLNSSDSSSDGYVEGFDERYLATVMALKGLTDTEDINVSDGDEGDLLASPVPKNEPQSIPESIPEKIIISERRETENLEDIQEGTDEEDFHMEENEDKKPISYSKFNPPISTQAITHHSDSSEGEDALTDIDDINIEDKDDEDIFNDYVQRLPDEDSNILLEMECESSANVKGEVNKIEMKSDKKFLLSVREEDNEALTDIEEWDESGGINPVRKELKGKKIDKLNETDSENIEDSEEEKFSRRRSRKILGRSKTLPIVPQFSEFKFVETESGPLSIVITPDAANDPSRKICDSVKGIVFLEDDNEATTDVEDIGTPVREKKSKTESSNFDQNQEQVTDTEDFEGQDIIDNRPATPLPPDNLEIPSPKREKIYIVEDEFGVPHVKIEKLDTPSDISEEVDQVDTDTDNVDIPENEIPLVVDTQRDDDDELDMFTLPETGISEVSSKFKTKKCHELKVKDAPLTDEEEITCAKKGKRKPRSKRRFLEAKVEEGGNTDVEMLSGNEEKIPNDPLTTEPKREVRSETDCEQFDSSGEYETYPKESEFSAKFTLMSGGVKQVVLHTEQSDGSFKTEIIEEKDSETKIVSEDPKSATDTENVEISEAEEVYEGYVPKDSPSSSLPANEESSISVSLKAFSSHTRRTVEAEEDIKENLLFPEAGHTDVESLDEGEAFSPLFLPQRGIESYFFKGFFTSKEIGEQKSTPDDSSKPEDIIEPLEKEKDSCTPIGKDPQKKEEKK